jgi:hypothetical protein
MDPNTPAWALAAAAAIGALCLAGYQVIKFASFAGDKWLEWSRKRRKQQREEDAEDDRVAGVRWADVVNRLTQELKNHETRLQSAEREATEYHQGKVACEAAHEGTKRLLRFWFIWAKSNGMKIPKDLEVEVRQVLEDSSGPHSVVRGEGVSHLQGDET